MSKKVLYGICAAGALVSISACSDDENTRQVSEHELQPLVRISLTAEQQGFVNRTNDFAFNLAEAIESAGEGNMNVSPLSTAYVLGMLMNGADGETQTQITKALGFGDGGVQPVNEYFQRLREGAPQVDKSVKIYVANGIIADSDFALKDAYKTTVVSVYDAKAETYDFASGDVASKVNSWAREKTDGNIPAILDGVSSNARMYALNAIYFKGIWTEEFDSGKTREETFTAADGTATLVPMMRDERTMLYGENETFTMVQLPYGNGGWSMEVLLPAEGKTVGDVLAALDGAMWKTALENLRNYSVDLKLPRFEITDEIRMDVPLQAIGITDAFDPSRADFSRLSDQATCVTQFIQRTRITVDEKGTEAATVTAAEIGDLAILVEKAVFHADRPFLFLITENTTGTIYFIGTKKN